MNPELENIEADGELLDLLSGKRAALSLNRRTLEFELPVGVFSSHEVDRGTLMLLRELEKAGAPQGAWLDAGCGCGPIALAALANGWAERAAGLERDALALDFARRNARSNGLVNAEWIGGVAYPEGLGRFDSIATNLPAKAGDDVHRLILLGAAKFLKPEGRAWCVVVAPLGELIAATLHEPGVELLHVRESAEYWVMQYRFKRAPEVSGRPYDRLEGWFDLRGASYFLRTAYGLEEFDRPSFETQLLAELFEKGGGLETESVAIADGGPGHLAAWCATVCSQLKTLCLVSRDALALRQSCENLSRAEFSGEVRALHSVDFSIGARDGCDWLLMRLNEKEGIGAALWRLRRCLADGAAKRVALVCNSGFGGRLEKALRREGMHIPRKKKSKGLWGAVLVSKSFQDCSTSMLN
ncbi:methyltransferase [Candidatus Sumerlaeota bacterium]|nr:methyltransferase [Candidatus Sumerlaeota bacterium]